MSALGGQKRASEQLEVEYSYVVVSHPMWALGTEFVSPARAVLALKH